MKQDEIKALRENNGIDSVKITKSPLDTREWVLLFKQSCGKSFFLVAEDDEVRRFASLEEVVEVLDSLGFARAEILF